MNPVHIDIKRIEFSVTKACSGRCRHCSAAAEAVDAAAAGAANAAVAGAATSALHASMDAGAAVKVIRDLAGRYAVSWRAAQQYCWHTPQN